MMQRIFPIVLLVIAIGIFFTYTSPTFAGPVGSAQTKIRSYNSALDAAEAFKEQESRLAIERTAIPAEGLTRLEAFLPDNVNNIQLILDLDALAARAGVQLSNFSIEGDGAAAQTQSSGDGALALESTNPVGSIDVTVTAVGSYGAFRNFLESAEKSLRLLDVVGINITSSDSGVYTYDVTLRIYWLQ